MIEIRNIKGGMMSSMYEVSEEGESQYWDWQCEQLDELKAELEHLRRQPMTQENYFARDDLIRKIAALSLKIRGVGGES
jgi:hypothetical protein